MEADDRFNTIDYLLFFVKGPDDIEYNNGKEIFYYENNLYTDKNYFFLTIAQDNGKRITNPYCKYYGKIFLSNKYLLKISLSTRLKNTIF
ncbi:MAG: hypothetical protein U5K54_27565 [Cytophagales bacterium]|nr:hypothetical protein [Cytophagales bacterium]